MKDEFSELYNKILDNQDWTTEDLDLLLELIRAQGYLCGKLAGKHLLREYYNAIAGRDIDTPSREEESPLLKRVREFTDN